jgi:WD40 repeat protein
MSISCLVDTHSLITLSTFPLLHRSQHIQTLDGHSAEVWAMAIGRAGDVVVTAGGDKGVRVWEQVGVIQARLCLSLLV